MDTKKILARAVEAAEAACVEILKIYNTADFQVDVKNDNSPLTLADKKSHDVIEKILAETQLPVLSEEGKNIPYETRKAWSHFWLIDPLDGTKEFIRRNGEFTVNIALVENQTPVLGVVAVPVTGDVYYASAGMGAYHKRPDVESPLPRRSPADLSKTGLRIVASRSHMNEETETFIRKLDAPELISAGSSLKFMLLASGAADVYPRFAPTMEWDTAAPHAILKELGLKVFRQNSDEELVYNKPDLLNPHFICY
jgi:3'(2'), 5'-bisphosphate nucleotidase